MYPNELKTASQAELLQMLCMGLGKTFLEWWEASRRNFTGKLKACRVKLNTSLVPFTLQTKMTVTDSHNFFHALRWIMFTLNQTTQAVVPTYLQLFITQRAHAAQALVGRLTI